VPRKLRPELINKRDNQAPMLRSPQLSNLRAAARIYAFQRQLSYSTPDGFRTENTMGNGTTREIPLAITYDDVLLVPKVGLPFTAK